MPVPSLVPRAGLDAIWTALARSVRPLLAAAVLLSGCATGTARSAPAATSDEMRQVREDIAALRVAVEQMRAESDRIAEQLGRAVERQARRDAATSSLLAELPHLSKAVGDVTGRLDALASRVERDLAAAQEGQRGVADGIAGLDRRTTELAQSVASLDARVASTGDAVARLASEGQDDRPAPAAAPERADPATPSAAKAIYDAAYLDFSRGSYSLAIGGFSELLRRFPDAPLADDAQYWLGESHWALARWHENTGQAEHAAGERRQAAADLAKVVEQYPRSDKAPTALYREALILGELGESAQARERLERLLASFPQAAETRLAREKLGPKDE